MVRDWISTLGQFLKDPQGRNSSMRIAAIFATTIIMLVWAWASLFEVEGLATLPSNVLLFATMLWGAKQVQRYFESPVTTRSEEQTSPNNVSHNRSVPE